MAAAQTSRLSGRAEAFPGYRWARSGRAAEAGARLPFIASFDCAALPRVEGLPLLTDGLLLFFLHHEDDHMEGGDEFARVLYVPAGTDTAVAPLPCDPDSEIYCDGIPFLIREYPLSAQVEADLPEWIEERDDDWPFDVESEPVQQLYAELKHIDELCEVVDDLWQADWDSTFSIGGHYMDIGGDEGPWYRMASENVRKRSGAEPGLPISDENRLIREEAYQLSQEWVMLAQFCTESEFHYGCFLINPDDLAAKRFDKVCSFTRFTEQVAAVRRSTSDHPPHRPRPHHRRPSPDAPADTRQPLDRNDFSRPAQAKGGGPTLQLCFAILAGESGSMTETAAS
ncbi:DUF1963 domain-containing protein [Lentzea sp. E54]|uniref:DUF1963 domain-containing protein n=1 Tax=Lentzea xerophila TaxID=3435883 RepID=UPI003DA2B6FC